MVVDSEFSSVDITRCFGIIDIPGLSGFDIPGHFGDVNIPGHFVVDIPGNSDIGVFVSGQSGLEIFDLSCLDISFILGLFSINGTVVIIYDI